MIKLILKQNNITLTQFAADLNVSRPTLDSYISAFDGGNQLANPIYQEIFDFLFSDTSISDKEFIKRYEYMRHYYYSSGNTESILESTKKTTSNYAKDEFDALTEEIVSILDKEKEHPTISTDALRGVIDILKTNATEVSDYISFITYLKGAKKLSFLTDYEKKRYYYFYQSERSFKHPNARVDDSVFQNFVAECKMNFEKTNQQIKKIREALDERIEDLIKTELNKVQDNNKIDISEVIDLIKKKL